MHERGRIALERAGNEDRLHDVDVPLAAVGAQLHLHAVVGEVGEPGRGQLHPEDVAHLLRELAMGIKDARFVTLESPNHLLLEQEPAWPKFLAEVRTFLAE